MTLSRTYLKVMMALYSSWVSPKGHSHVAVLTPFLGCSSIVQAKLKQLANDCPIPRLAGHSCCNTS